MNANSAQLKSGRWWVVTGSEEETAAERFATKFGYQPDYILEAFNKLWLGPVREGNLGNDNGIQSSNGAGDQS